MFCILTVEFNIFIDFFIQVFIAWNNPKANEFFKFDLNMLTHPSSQTRMYGLELINSESELQNSFASDYTSAISFSQSEFKVKVGNDDVLSVDIDPQAQTITIKMLFTSADIYALRIKGLDRALDKITNV